MPRVQSASSMIAEMVKKQLEKMEEQAEKAEGMLSDSDIDRLEKLTRINKLNIVVVRPRAGGDSPSDPPDVSDEQLTEELRAAKRTAEPELFAKRGRKAGRPAETVAPPVPKLCEEISPAGNVCTLMGPHPGADHRDAAHDVSWPG